MLQAQPPESELEESKPESTPATGLLGSGAAHPMHCCPSLFLHGLEGRVQNKAKSLILKQCRWSGHCPCAPWPCSHTADTAQVSKRSKTKQDSRMWETFLQRPSIKAPCGTIYSSATTQCYTNLWTYMVISLEAYSALVQKWNTAQLCSARVWGYKLGLLWF